MTQGDLNAAAKGLNMVAMSTQELKDLAKEFGAIKTHAAKAITMAARQMAAVKKSVYGESTERHVRKNPVKRRVVKKTVCKPCATRKKNPVKPHRPVFADHVKFNFDNALREALNDLTRAVHERKNVTVVQAYVSYMQGLIDAAVYMEYFESAAIGQKWKQIISKLVPLRIK